MEKFRSEIVSSLTVLAAVLLLAGFAAAQGPAQITLDQAINLALAHNHALKATRSLVAQSKADELTASLRPNPALNADTLYLPLFNPSTYNTDYLSNIQEFDVGVSYLFERGKKRQHRVQAAKDATAVTQYQVDDSARQLIFNVAQQFIQAQLAESTLNFANQDLASFEQTVKIGEEQYRVGDISEGDLLKIKVQLLQFQTDVAAARVAKAQALASLRQLLGYDSVPTNYEIVGEFKYEPIKLNEDDLQAKALKMRPDLMAAEQGVRAAQSQIALAKANAKVDVTGGLTYTHVASLNSLSTAISIPLPIFDRNQGEIERTRFAETQAQETARETTDAVLTDVRNNYDAFQTNQNIVQLYLSGYLKQAKDSRDISRYAYKRGAVSLLDFLDAERSYRSTQLSYRQALANYLISLEQLKAAVGTRTLP